VRRRLLVGYLALILVFLVVLEVPLAIAYARYERRDLQARVERDAVALASLAEDALSTGRPLAGVRSIARRYAADTRARVIIVNRRGVSLLDTNPAFAGERRFASRPEVAKALHGVVASGTRYSHTLGHGLVYAAVPVASGGVVRGAVRLTYPTSVVDSRIHRTWLLLVLIGAIALSATALVGLALSHWIARPVAEVEAAADRVGEGDLAARAPEQGPPEIRALARSFNTTAAKLEAHLDSQAAFAADASHQLRTPLTALRLRLENLQADGSDVAPALSEVERLSRIVDDLLALARSDASEAPAESLDVASVLRERVDAWAPLAAERGVVLTSSGDGRVRAARTRIDQVLDNLVANALEASPEGGTIALEAVRDGDWVELHVVDEGPGLSPVERRRAFDRFWRAGSGSGSGLGLAIVARLVQVDGGSAELRAARSGGVDAVVRLRPPRHNGGPWT
jgi:signal transduction histidine kinase